jgi:hypothetical protein
MNARTVRTGQGSSVVKNYKFPINNEEQKYEARITFTAREVQSFDVNFLFDIAQVVTTNTPGNDLNALDQIAEAADARVKAAAIEAANKGGPGSQAMINATGKNLKVVLKVRCLYTYHKLYKLMTLLLILTLI